MPRKNPTETKMTPFSFSTKIKAMNYKSFPDSYWKNIETALKEIKASGDPVYAAFDADGTLWDTDLGENFFNYQIEQNLVRLPEDAWNYYVELKKVDDDPRAAYLWLAQINRGQPLAQVKKWAQEAYIAIQPNPIFNDQRKLIELLKENGVRVFVVTASIRWAVEPGARAMGLSDDDVIGVETEVENGLVTDIPVYPITYRSGKTEALLKMTAGARPFFCSGNTMGDLELLLCATHVRLAVSAASRDDRLFKTESDLLRRATEFGWLGHRFI